MVWFWFFSFRDFFSFPFACLEDYFLNTTRMRFGSWRFLYRCIAAEKMRTFMLRECLAVSRAPPLGDGRQRSATVVASCPTRQRDRLEAKCPLCLLNHFCCFKKEKKKAKTTRVKNFQYLLHKASNDELCKYAVKCYNLVCACNGNKLSIVCID